MSWSQIRRTAVLALVALLVVGATTAPVTATALADGIATAESEQDDQVLEVACTDVTDLVVDEVPFDRVIWVDDLPKELQPDNVPSNLVTPRTVASIATGVTPDQCDVIDPNDPPYDPREDDVDPDGGADVVEETDEGSTLIVVNGTLNRSADGPGFEVLLDTVPESDGELDPEVRINDGEKDYALDPGVQYWADGTVYLENDVVVIGKRAGVEYDCNGETCDLDLRGAPRLIDFPAIPSHADEDHLSEPQAEEGDDGVGDGSDDTDPTDPTEETDTTGASDPGGADDPETTNDGDDGSDAESNGSDDGSADDGSDDGSNGSDDGSADDGSDEVTATTDGDAGDDAEQPAQAGVQADGPGFGAGLAVLSVLITTFVVRRRFT